MSVTNLNDKGPGSLREALESRQPFERIVVPKIAGTIALETDIRIFGNVTLDASKLRKALVLTQRGLVWNRAQSVSLNNVAIYPGTKTVLDKIDSPWADAGNGIRKYKLPELVAKNVPAASDLFQCFYSTVEIGEQRTLKKERPLEKCRRWSEFKKAGDESWCWDPAHDRQHVYIRTARYRDSGQCVITTKKSSLPDAITIRDRGPKGIGRNRFTNCSFGLGTDNTVSGFGEFKHCLIAFGVSINYHPKLGGHAKGIYSVIPGTFLRIDRSIITDAHGRMPRFEGGVNGCLTNSLFQKGTLYNLEVDSKVPSKGCKIDVKNCIFQNNGRYSLWMVLNSPHNKIYLSDLQFDKTFVANPLEIAHVHKKPFVARNKLGSQNAKLPGDSQLVTTPNWIDSSHSFVPIPQLGKYLVENVGASPKNRSLICRAAIRSVLTPGPAKIFKEFK